MDLIHQIHIGCRGLIHQARTFRGTKMREEEKRVVDCRGLIYQTHAYDNRMES